MKKLRGFGGNLTKRLLLSAAALGLMAGAGAANAECGEFCWQSSQANCEDGARWFLANMPDVWTKWVPAGVTEKIKASL